MDYESNDLDGAAYLAAEDSWDDSPSAWDERDSDIDYERAIDMDAPMTEAFYPEWTPDDEAELNSIILKICGHPVDHKVDFNPYFEPEDMPF